MTGMNGDSLSLIGRILYALLGMFTGFIIFSTVFPHTQKITTVDIWRFFISPGIISLIAATIGARAGAHSNTRAMEKELAKTYWSLLDLASRDIRINVEIMQRVRDRIAEIERAGRKPVFYELEPESVHTMFFQDIEYPRLRKVVSGRATEDIFHVRNLKYIFDRWNATVQKYYATDKPLLHDEGEAELVRFLKPGTENFIQACIAALEGVERIKAEISCV